ncbi:MAG: hypothetical protein H6Q13_442 [Bacteroidetes bacterium]|nr:hypothetical protein [Bacteroidota bacterium]
MAFYLTLIAKELGCEHIQILLYSNVIMKKKCFLYRYIRVLISLLQYYFFR